MPWKLSFSGPVMYSKLHLQPTDKSTLCWAWRMAVKIKIHYSMLLCQEEGHFRFCPSHPGISAQSEAEMTICLWSFNIFSSLFGSMRWQVSDLFASTAVSPSWVPTLWAWTKKKRSTTPLLMCQQYLLFAEGEWLYIYRAVIVCVCGYIHEGAVQLAW